MNLISLTPFFKPIPDAISRALDGTCYVVTGLAPTANGVGLRVDVASGDSVDNSTPHMSYAGGNITLTAAHATLYRRDIVYRNSAGTLSKTDGTAAAVTSTTPVCAALPAGATLLAICFVAPTQVTLTANDVEDCRQTRAMNDGTSAAPAYTYASDTDLGGYRLAANYAGHNGSMAIAGPYPWADVKAYGAKGDSNGTTGNGTDDTTAINSAITAAGVSGGVVLFPAGIYRTTSMLTIPRWITLIGLGFKKPGGTYDGVSVIYGDHTGNAIVSLKGALGCRIENLTIASASGTAPKSGLCLGRSSASSAGFHRFTNVTVDGYFSAAAVYSIASEENLWISPNIYLRGGGAKYAFYTGQGDDLSVNTLTASSNVAHIFIDTRIQNDTNAGADAEACIYIEGGAGSGDFKFFGGYLIPARGAYVVIRTGNEDGASMVRPVAFYGVSGEMGSISTGPLYGFDMQTVGVLAISGLIIEDSYMPCRAGGNFIRQNGSLTLKSARIRTPANDRAPDLTPTKMTNCDIDLGSGSEIIRQSTFVDQVDRWVRYWHPGMTIESTLVGTGALTTEATGAHLQLGTGGTTGGSSALRLTLNLSSAVTGPLGTSQIREFSFVFDPQNLDANTSWRIFATDENVAGNPSLTARHLGLRYDGTNVLFSTADNTTEQTTSVTASLTANAEYHVTITFDGTTARLYSAGLLLATHATNVPGSVATTGSIFRAYIVTAANAAKNLFLSGLRVRGVA